MIYYKVTYNKKLQKPCCRLATSLHTIWKFPTSVINSTNLATFSSEVWQTNCVAVTRIPTSAWYEFGIKEHDNQFAMAQKERRIGRLEIGMGPNCPSALFNEITEQNRPFAWKMYGPFASVGNHNYRRQMPILYSSDYRTGYLSHACIVTDTNPTTNSTRERFFCCC